MSKSNAATPFVVAAEGTAFNAPGSDRVSGANDGNSASRTTSQFSQEDELDWLEQLSRLNSDFEDGLDVVRELESHCRDDGPLSPTFASLVARASFEVSARVRECARTYPTAFILGVSAVGTFLGIALFRRSAALR